MEQSEQISIHSPRMGRDADALAAAWAGWISIHSPRMGRDQMATTGDSRAAKFQSTLPAWGETRQPELVGPAGVISIHSPRMGRDRYCPACAKEIWISIHSPRMGRDPSAPEGRGPTKHFNPLSPHGERPHDVASIKGKPNFNPLSPHGERQAVSASCDNPIRFQSTLPAWGRDSVTT